jgi:hypothetical protein
MSEPACPGGEVGFVPPDTDVFFFMFLPNVFGVFAVLSRTI